MVVCVAENLKSQVSKMAEVMTGTHENDFANFDYTFNITMTAFLNYCLV